MRRMPYHRLFDNPAHVLEYEIAQERASALGRMGRRLEKALSDLRAFEAEHGPAHTAATKARRRALIEAAGEALWMFVVQREACGLRDSRTVMRDYQVPPEVQACQGLVIKGR